MVSRWKNISKPPLARAEETDLWLLLFLAGVTGELLPTEAAAAAATAAAVPNFLDLGAVVVVVAAVVAVAVVAEEVEPRGEARDFGGVSILLLTLPRPHIWNFI